MKQNNKKKKKKKYTMIKKAVSNLKINGNTHVISHNLDPQWINSNQGSKVSSLKRNTDHTVKKIIQF